MWLRSPTSTRSGSSNASDFLSALGTIFFAADNGTDGKELYATDGTPGGTFQVADVQPGPEGSNPIPLHDTGQRLLFNASGRNGLTDREFWSTDGVAGNAWLVEDLYPSEFFGSDPEQVVPIGDTVYFLGENGLSGQELFQMNQVDVVLPDFVIGSDANDPPMGESQRSTVELVRAVFEGQIDVPSSAIQLRNRDTNTVLTSVQSNTVFDADTNQTILELTFGSGPSVVDRDPLGATGFGNSLDDGNYELTLDGAQVSSLVSGSNMTGDAVFGAQAADNFFRRFGATDLDRDVDGQDYGRFGSAIFSLIDDPSYNPALDFDGDGDIDGQDFGQFGTRLFVNFPFV